MQLALKKSNSILIWLVCLMYVGLFFPIPISNIPLILLVVFAIANTNVKEVLVTIKESTFSKLIIGMYLLQIIGLLYTTNLKTGFFMLEKKLCFLLIPLFILPSLKKLNSHAYTELLKTIGFITLISSVVLLCIATFRLYVLNYSKAFFFESFSSFEGFSPIHYVYYSMYFACGSLILMSSLFDTLRQKKYGLFILILLFVYSLSIIILIGSKTGIISFTLASIYLLYKKISNKKAFFFLVVLIALSASILLYFNQTTRNRFIGLSENLSVLTKDELTEKVTITDLNMRLLFWKISILHSWQDHLTLAGVGTGDTQDYLDSLYTSPKYQLYGYKGWDSHNQWVYTFIELGLIGVSLMAFLYIKCFKEALKKTNLEFISFLLITLFFSFSESILESNKGIVFFSLFMTLFAAAEKPNTKQEN